MVARTGHFPLRSVLILACSIVLPSMASAQGVGFMGGMTIDPEQGFVGTYYESREFVRGLHFRPGVDGAFGSDLKIASFNVDFIFKYDTGGAWKIYQGGGPAVYVVRFSDFDQTDVTGGLNAIFGFEHQSGFLAEFRVGSGRGPILKFGVGFTIR